MAVLAGDILVRPLQRKISLRFVIKNGRLPFLRVVTCAAVLRLTCFNELPAVRILVTRGTLRRRRFERRLGQLPFCQQRLVAFIALDLGVSAQ